jgi:hypothetical protein
MFVNVFHKFFNLDVQICLISSSYQSLMTETEPGCEILDISACSVSKSSIYEKTSVLRGIKRNRYVRMDRRNWTAPADNYMYTWSSTYDHKRAAP